MPRKPAGGGGVAVAPSKEHQIIDKGVVIPVMRLRDLRLTIIGDTPLICHKWSEKAIGMIRAKHMKQALPPKGPMDPQAEFEGSLYHLEGGKYGFPASGVKSAAVDACSFISGVTKVVTRGTFHIEAEFVTIDGVPTPREDMVRIAMGTADLRIRGEFKDWRSTFTIRYNADVLSPEQLINLFDTAGFAIGLGEWRPQKDGSNGRFHVERLGE